MNSGKLVAGTTLLSALPLEMIYAKRKKVSANDKIQMALIGCKGMGWSDLTAHLKIPDVEFVALCDVDESVLNQRAAELEKITGKKPKLYKDFRKLLQDKDIDAVIIGTPDHWHCLMMIAACEAGKDVYVEKPLGNSIAECMAMVAAKNKYNRIVQVGQWQRSNQHWKDAAEYVQSGKLGKIRMTKAWVYIDWKSSVPVFPDEPVPAGVDYDMWLGPAPQHAFNRNRFHFNFRWFWEYAGGLMTDWGVHLIDMVMMGMKVKTPASVMSLGGKYAFPDDAMVTPDTLTTVYDFKDFSLTWEHTIGIATAPYGRAHGVAFVGSLGTLVADRQQWMVLPETDGKHYKTEYLPIQKASDSGLDLHAVNFIDCLKDRSKTPNCSIEIAANTAMVSHMGNAAYRTKEKLDWDEKSKLFVNNNSANALITPTYRSPWKFPKIA